MLRFILLQFCSIRAFTLQQACYWTSLFASAERAEHSRTL